VTATYSVSSPITHKRRLLEPIACFNKPKVCSRNLDGAGFTGGWRTYEEALKVPYWFSESDEPV
jgi:hypothetical protein